MARWWRGVVGLLLLLVVCGVNFCWIAGRAEAQSASPNLLVVTGRTLKEYTLGGSLVRTVTIVADSNSDAGWARDVAVDDFGRAHVYDGTFNPSLNTYDPSTGAWSPRKFPGWSTVNNVSFGGVATFGSYVFATDMWTAGNVDPDARGLIRFDLSNNTATRFSPNLDFIDVNVGLDGLLYGLQGEYTLEVFNPTTLAHIRTINLGADVRAVAVDTNGEIYGASWSFRVHKFSSSGTLLQSLDTAGNSTIDIDLDSDGRIIFGSRDGRVYVTNRQLAAPVVFDASPAGFDESFVTFAKIPPAPTNLIATAVSSTQINLSWEDHSSTETAFQIERKFGAQSFGILSTVGANVTTYQDTGLTPNTEYTYRVRALLPAGPTGYTPEVSARTPEVSPEAPTNLTAAAVSFSQIQLNWQDNSPLETAYEVERQLGAGGFSPVAILAANSTSYLDNGLQPQTTYGYRVRAVRNSAASPYSNVATATTPAKPLVPPTGLTAGAVSSTQVRLAWRDETDTETGFEIERKVSGGVYASLTTTGPAAGLGSLVSYTDASGLQPGQTYVYHVRAVGALGVSAYSTEASVTTTPLPPAAPSGLTASLIASTTVSLSWTDNSNNETAFRIERKTGSGSFTFIGSTLPDVTTFPDAGLPADTVVTYQVRALGNGGNSAYSNSVATATAPPPPANVTAALGGAGQLVVSWTDTSQSETGFKVERKGPGTGFAPVATFGTGVTGFTDSGLAPGTTYTYRVRTVNAGGDSAPSNEASRLTLPAAPTSLVASPLSSTLFLLSWSDGNPSPPAVKIERGLAQAGPFIQVGTSAAGTTSYQDTLLAPNTTYYYRVRATNASGDSGYSNVAFGTTPPNPPAAPSGLTAVAASARSVQLTWQDNSGNETGFELLRLSPQGGGYQLVTTAGADTTSYLDTTGLSGSSSYSYKVRAINAGGVSSYSNTATVTTLPDLPGTPTGLAAQALSAAQIRLTWTDPGDYETGFRLERKPDGGSYQVVTTTGANATEYVDGGLTESTRYTYRVIGVNAQGESAPSAEVSATTRPQSPGSLAATAGNRRIDLTWQDRSAGETGFRIERSSGSGFSAVHTTAAGITSYADTAVTPGATYTYRVFAISPAGDSAASNESSASPRDETPLARLVLSTKALKFGTVKLGKTKQLNLTLTNKGKETVTGTVGTLAAPFTLVAGGGSFTLAPKGKRTVTVRFAPAAPGAAIATLRVTSTDPKATLVEVSLTAVGK